MTTLVLLYPLKTFHFTFIHPNNFLFIYFIVTTGNRLFVVTLVVVSCLLSSANSLSNAFGLSRVLLARAGK